MQRAVPNTKRLQLEARPRRSAADSIRSVSEVEEVVCVC
eukprot:COSAG02_NODE_30505_length_549_cov_2.533333_1_plen_38_part_01